jgi:Holliday junction DNA helicase RuvA
MIASIQGEVIHSHQDSIVIAVGGIGIQVYVPQAVVDSSSRGQIISLYTHLVVREDSLTLFGFENETAREYFQLLIGVSGVGPRSALSILSKMPVESIRQAVLSDQSDVFSRVPGIGKKTAQKIILHLDGKVGKAEVFELSPGAALETDLLEALTGLGYSVVEAQSAIQALPKDAPTDFEERLMAVLQYLGQ